MKERDREERGPREREWRGYESNPEYAKLFARERAGEIHIFSMAVGRTPAECVLRYIDKTVKTEGQPSLLPAGDDAW
jgi:hypothetical protein